MSDAGAPPPPGTPPPRQEQASWFAPPGHQPAYATPGYIPPSQLPPPGYAPLPPAPGGYPTGPYSAPGGPAPVLAAIHKPGAIPIRPLGLGDIYDGAFKIIRFSPGATVGSALLVAAVAMAIPLLVTGILTSALDLSLSSIQDTGDGSTTLTTSLATNGTFLGSALLQLVGVIFVTGMIAHVSAAAAVGRKLSLGQAWAATAGKRWKLVGLMAILFAATALYVTLSVLLVVLLTTTTSADAAAILAVLIAIAATCGLVYLWGRIYYLAVPPLMIEPIGIWAALGRSWRLTSRQFWRTFGIALLTMIITQTIGSIMGIPFGVVAGVANVASGDGRTGLIVYLLMTALATVVSSAFVTPFTSAVTTLQYIDQRMRKEGYDVELLTGAANR
jgi:hypothetical protein